MQDGNATPTNRAAIYARSSKDRSDISPATQKQALETLASSRSLRIVETYEDAVESGATEDRPGFQSLIRAVKDNRRGWNHLLVYDTSRIARRRHIAQAFKHELRKRGITLIYATRPADIDPISEVVLDSVFEAMDEVLSMMSREKGLAGMAENVRQGFRAGGRPPLGYRLEHMTTGAVRDGKPVTKSRLVLAENAGQVRTYLRSRLRGTPRSIARREAGLDNPENSLICVEWNALTYAGSTVWNVHAEQGSGAKRRPRAEWRIQPRTHEPLISEREAEALLSALETSNVAASQRAARAAGSRFLLSGLVYSTDGRSWEGNGRNYRLRRVGDLPGRAVNAADLEEAVTRTLMEFRTSERYLGWLLDQSRRADSTTGSPARDIVGQIRRLERERTRAAAAAVTGDDGGVYAEIVRERTRQIDALKRELEAVEREAATESGLKSLGIDEIRELVHSQEPARVIRTLVDRVMLEPTLTCQVRLRPSAQSERWASLASPGRTDSHPLGFSLVVSLIKRA